MADTGKQKALDTTLANLKKRFGEGTVMKLGEAERMKVAAIPTGSLSLDLALGIGGVPRGRITEIYGPESSGKTTICQHIIAEAQKMGGIAAFIDVEHALDPDYAARCGVNIDELYISQPDTGEQALEIAEALIRSGAIDVVVIDSVAALVPRAEIEGEMGDSHVGLQARLMSQALRKLVGAINTQQHGADLHQSAAPEDRRDVWQPGDDVGWAGAEVLCQRAHGRAAHREHQTGRTDRWAAGRGSPSRRTRWRRRSARQSSTSCTTRESAKPATCWTWARPWASSRSAGRSTAIKTCAWVRDARTPRNFLEASPAVAAEIELAVRSAAALAPVAPSLVASSLADDGDEEE